MASKETMRMRGIAPTPRVAKSMPPSLRRQYRGMRRRSKKLIATRGVPPWTARKLQ